MVTRNDSMFPESLVGRFGGSSKKNELAVLTVEQRMTMEDPNYPSNVVGIKEDILWYLKRSNAGKRPETIANDTNHSYQAVQSALKDLEKERRIQWTPF